MYKVLEQIDKLLENNKDITGYRIEINTEYKNFLLEKQEKEKVTHSNAIGFTIPNKDVGVNYNKKRGG